MPEYKTKNKESDLKLSIHVHVNGLSFFTHNQKTNKASQIYREVFDAYVPVENLHEHIRATLKTQGILEKRYNEVRCSVENNLATMVPKSLFEEAALHEYVQKDIDVKPNDFITYDVEPSTDWICVYAPFVNVNNMLLDAFGSFSYYHAVSVWLSALSRHSAADGALVWGLYKERDHLHIALLRDKKLQFYNCFEATKAKDVVYYVLLTAKEKNISPNEVPLFIAGDIAVDDEIYKGLHEFVRSINPLAVENDLEHVVQRISTHQDFCLLNLF
ncbi:DUF3822 family protein [Flavobacteriaceae bacterium]|nr:DUF3822 family protein [Flavobacteriaceae bacterium]